MFDMIGNIFKNMSSKPATRQYPKEVRSTFKNTRGHIGIEIDNCIFCGICSKKCPSSAITVDRNEKSWEIDPFKCIICNVCEEVCPKKCILNHEAHNTSALVKEKRKSIQAPKPPKEAAPAAATPKAAAPAVAAPATGAAVTPAATPVAAATAGTGEKKAE
jgi:formate hydrogenlyase subunit 6/NADH:ubiquinone oxidoreductase subunit I